MHCSFQGMIKHLIIALQENKDLQSHLQEQIFALLIPYYVAFRCQIKEYTF